MDKVVMNVPQALPNQEEVAHVCLVRTMNRPQAPVILSVRNAPPVSIAPFTETVVNHVPMACTKPPDRLECVRLVLSVKFHTPTNKAASTPHPAMKYARPGIKCLSYSAWESQAVAMIAYQGSFSGSVMALPDVVIVEQEWYKIPPRPGARLVVTVKADQITTQDNLFARIVAEDSLAAATVFVGIARADNIKTVPGRVPARHAHPTDR